MLDFTPEPPGRWNAWQQDNAISMPRNDRLARVVILAMFGGSLAALAAAIWGFPS